MKILISANAAALATAIAGRPSATVEAEYGDTVVEGSIITMAHHGARAAYKPPCQWEVSRGYDLKAIEVIGLSHVDLDALGGVMLLRGGSPDQELANAFWNLAGFVDVKGPHRIHEACASSLTIRQLNAWWATAPRIMPPRPPVGEKWPDGDPRWVADVTAEVTKAICHVSSIITGEPALLAAGDKFAADTEALSKESILWMCYDKLGAAIIAGRSSDKFVNHLYALPCSTGTQVADAVIGFNEKTKAITLSWADPDKAVASAAEIMKGVFGTDAGGHKGIAGTPRDKEYDVNEMWRVVRHIRELEQEGKIK